MGDVTQATDDLKESLLEAAEVFSDWKPGHPEPTIRCEGINRPISWLCTALAGCTDVMPDEACRFFGLEAGATYHRGAATLQRKIEQARRFQMACPTGQNARPILWWRDREAKTQGSDLHILLSAVATMSIEELGQFC